MANKKNAAIRDLPAPATERDKADGPVAGLMEFAEPGREDRAVRLRSGRSVVVEQTDEDLVTVVGPEGNVELSVRFTAAGPVLTFQAAAIRMKTPGKLDLDCGKLAIRSRHGIDLETQGDLTQNVDGRHTLRVGGGSLTDAHSVEVRSQRGDVKLSANDNVRVSGEKILLNC
jgi:hypothetical protein